MIQRALLGAALLSACDGNKIEECTAEFASVTPADGAGPVGASTALVVTLDGTVTEATFTVATDADEAIAGTTTVSDNTATFTPDGGWPAGATIEWSVQACESEASGSFVVGTLDEALDPTTLEGDTYTVDLTSATWVSPPGAGVLIGQFFQGVFLLGVTDVEGEDLSCLLGVGEETSGDSYQQDPCYPTVTFEDVDFSGNPYISVQAEQMEFEVQTIAVVVHNVSISGGLTADTLVDGRFQGEADLREYSEFGIDCAQLEQFLGTPCAPCTSDGEEYCLVVEAVDVTGVRIGGLTLVENENPDECTPDTDA